MIFMKNIKFNNVNDEDISLLYTLINKTRDRLSLFNDMVYIRAIETNCQELYGLKMIRGFCHLVTGQEHIYAALRFVLKIGKDKYSGDKVMSSYRCHGLVYITGSSIKEIVGEMMGKKSGLCGGRGGSMHLYNDTFFGGHGIVGSQVGLSCGIAFAQKFLKQEYMTFCFLGDGAMNQGQVYESMNLAYIYTLPIVFIIENNGYGMWTQGIDRDELFKRVSFKSMKVSKGIKATDIVGIFEWAKRLATMGPILIEIEVDRLCGHSCKDEIKNEYPVDAFNEFKDLNHVIPGIKEIVYSEIQQILNEPEAELRAFPFN